MSQPVLVNTSVWIDHLRIGDDRLVSLLNHGQALAHPMVIGELACGRLQGVAKVMGLAA